MMGVEAQIPMTRREMVQAFGALAAAGATSPAGAADSKPANEFRLGICSYSVREFQRTLAISLMKQLNVGYVSVKDFHLPYTSTAAEIAKARNEFQKAGLTIVSGGNTDLKDEDPAALRRYFEYA